MEVYCIWQYLALIVIVFRWLKHYTAALRQWFKLVRLSTTLFLLIGSRQGCPLYILYALSVEPLLQAIRQNPMIGPIIIKDTSHKISLYADNIILYFSDITNSLPQTMTFFSSFSSFSEIKINWEMSLLVP